MPKGRGSNPLSVRYKGRFALSGPPAAEHELRDMLQSRIMELLDECPRFAKTELPERYAFRLAWGAEYKRSNTERADIIDLTVVYRNKAEWKDWVVVRGGDVEFVATGEGRLSDYDE